MITVFRDFFVARPRLPDLAVADSIVQDSFIIQPLVNTQDNANSKLYRKFASIRLEASHFLHPSISILSKSFRLKPKIRTRVARFYLQAAVSRSSLCEPKLPNMSADLENRPEGLLLVDELFLQILLGVGVGSGFRVGV